MSEKIYSWRDVLATVPTDMLPGAIAELNAKLPDTAPEKITREKIAALRSAVDVWYSEHSRPEDAAAGSALMNEHLDALESYLPK